MSLFHNILLDISSRLKDNESYKEDISKIISIDVGVVVKPNNLKIKNGILFINISPTIKSAILLKKQKIIKDLEGYKIYAIR